MNIDNPLIPATAEDPRALAWAAGFLDGEGCFHVSRYPDGRYKTVAVSANNTDKDSLLRLQKVLGGKVRGPYKASTANRKPVYQWQISISAAADVMKLVRPLVNARRRAAIDKCLDALSENKGQRGRPRKHIDWMGDEAKTEMIWERDARLKEQNALRALEKERRESGISATCEKALPERFKHRLTLPHARRAIMEWARAIDSSNIEFLGRLTHHGYLATDGNPDKPIFSLGPHYAPLQSKAKLGKFI